jgi:hypothetical protein
MKTEYRLVVSDENKGIIHEGKHTVSDNDMDGGSFWWIITSYCESNMPDSGFVNVDLFDNDNVLVVGGVLDNDGFFQYE